MLAKTNIDGKGWNQVKLKEKLNQWFFNISKFSNSSKWFRRSEWPSKVKTMQKTGW